MLGGVDRFADRADVAGHTGRGLVVDHTDGLEFVTGVLGEEFLDRQDVSVLLRVLGLQRVEDAEAVLVRYYPLERYPARTRYVLEELLGQAS